MMATLSRLDRFIRLAGLAGTISMIVPLVNGQDTEFPGGGDIFELSPFEVSTSQDVGYLSTNSTSGTSLNTAIKDLPMAIQVINQDFITDTGASNLNEALIYAAGVFTDDNQASNSVGATRGTQGSVAGSGSGDRSVSSAGQSNRFANTVYIRGLSTPYQNRYGFRYGGLIVTPNSSIALGGMLDSANIERIEVVKGPNSLLYGVGVLTGIVNVIPEKPLSEPHYGFSIKGGNYDFLRTEAEFTGPIVADWIPGQLNYRAAGSIESRGNWRDFSEEETEYWTVQLDYSPAKWANLFLEYQDGFNRFDGIASQWIYDNVNNAKNTEFRNIYDEAYNWAKHDGEIPTLQPLDPNGYNTSLNTIDANGLEKTQPGFKLKDENFVGGGRKDGFRITGPDTFAEREEQNFLADLTLTPVKNLSINLGAFLASQETTERTMQFTSTDGTDSRNLVEVVIPNDAQLNSIWQSGGIYGVPMDDVVRDAFGLTTKVDPTKHTGSYILPATTDDIKLIEYWWRDSVVKSDSEQYRARATYSFDTPFFRDEEAHHTFLVGFSYIKDDIDFPDGGINRGNARANRSTDFAGIPIVDSTTTGSPVADPFNNDGLYYRSISNFEPIYFDGRNDGVDGHNTVRAGDVYLNQVIEQTGYYGIYQGKFFRDRLEVILGVRRDIYNATQLTHKRADVSDAFLREQALADVVKTAEDIAKDLGGGDAAVIEQIKNDIIAQTTADDRYITAWYRDSFESGDQGYFGYANRAGAPDETFGVVPGSKFDVFEDDIEVTTYTFGLNFDITPDLTIYGLYAQGISPNTALRDGAGDVIPAEETESREIGLKFDLMEGKISGNVALSRIDRENGIWDNSFAPNASRWLDAQNSLTRASDWDTPAYDPEVPTTYLVRGDYLADYIADEYGIDPGKLVLQAAGSKLNQKVSLGDLDPNLPILERLQLLKDVADKTVLPEQFANYYTSQAPFNGAVTLDYYGINPDGFDELMEVTFYNPETNEFITKDISNLPVIYSAFADRTVDFSKNSLLQDVHPIRYHRLSSDGQPQNNNNVDFERRALVTFDEEINVFEFEVFLTPTENLQFVINYSHIEREAKDSFQFTEWESIAGNDGTYIPAFSMLHREYGWENAGIDLAWVDFDAYEAARAASSDGVVSIDNLPESAVERVPDGESDTPISNETFVDRSAAGQLLLLVDQRGNVINENNNAKATDYSGILTGISLNYNPEDELSIFGKYTFTEGLLERLNLTAGLKYIGSSATSVSFNTVSPLAGLQVTPEVPERFQFDLGASYRWTWNNLDMRLSINVYNIFDKTYDVEIKTLDTRNPITGAEVTKRTEKYYTPTTFRVGLAVSF
ncbi:TonB-dependent receptor plug domain-containing protein [Puniceicoccales bacterium CK1056]|uniref:TonB-dependent receptor plug domain-containing protein n=1 Tax=Oceanipulchritudo coccoides TaxID=2706888 RepID=A0A6B2M237_9BACT|nr:TonB-dependent receptor plug domain-containing protein [Oceanipulchritudo coccoides]NDV62269.1 TonB-dependent receptor plug domain-containing protein [Oceanipulchritudo coccoides]